MSGVVFAGSKITVDEAKEVAMKYYKLLGFKEGEYEITSVRSDHIVGSEEKPGHEIDIVFSKKIALNEDAKIETNKIIETEVEKMVVTMNL